MFAVRLQLSRSATMLFSNVGRVDHLGHHRQAVRLAHLGD